MAAKWRPVVLRVKTGAEFCLTRHDNQDSPFEEHFPNLKVIIIEDVKTRFENSLEEQLLS
ncbi:hypothetical protein TYRP_005574 [Tyrophagus putrescentiae]|nr:hypothetical protein TYRP_005574 [Tyrophagus putrescentiae]